MLGGDRGVQVTYSVLVYLDMEVSVASKGHQTNPWSKDQPL
jgi:hypothetical protein